MIDLRDRSQSSLAVCEALRLAPHPEGGHFREVWRDSPVSGQRGAGTSILFLLAEGNGRAGTGSMLLKFGSGTRARRCCSESAKAADCSACGSAPI